MIEEQIQKRNVAWLAIFGLIVFDIVLLVVIPRAVHIQKGSFGPTFMLIGVFVSLAAKTFFWFKGFYHWSKAKGYSGVMALLGVLGFPIAPLILVFFRDKCPLPPPPNDPVHTCPLCSAKYRLGDYNPEAREIFCSICKAPLPRI
jgi:hypothetical protein